MMKSFCFLLLLCMVLTAAVTRAEVPDYGDIPEDAWTVPTDGTHVQGVIETEDVDWFTFTPPANTLYRVTLNGQVNAGYKYMTIYQIDEFGILHQTLEYWVYSNDTAARTFFIEAGDDIYIKLHYHTGGYTFYIDVLGQYPPDSYADTCAAAAPITVDDDPVPATLNHYPDGTLDVDWFEFATEPLHKYEIRLRNSSNTDVNFEVYDETCQRLLSGAKTRTVISWFGEPYKIFVYGNPDYLGTYYTLQVIDLGPMPDDYANIFETAQPIVPDGSSVKGQIQFSADHHSDQDWFVFTPTPHTLYQVTLKGQLNAGYKYMTLYQIDEFGNLHQTLEFWAYSDGTSVKTVFLEEGMDVYVKLFHQEGSYTFHIDTLGQYPPDGFAGTCAEATPIIVDAAPVEATLDHNPDGSLTEDWFEFATEPLHKYEIRLTKSDNTDVNFQVFDENCQHLLSGAKGRTVISWFGEPYKLQVYGNPGYLGTWYTLEVVDLGVLTDDYPSTPNDAPTVPEDGTHIEGHVQFEADHHSDEDWFTFVAGLDGEYDFFLTGEVGKGYKYIRVFWEDELGVLRKQTEKFAYSDNVNNFTVTLPAGRIYLQLFYHLGGYTFSVVSPEPRCGDLDHPYPPGDANQDCYVNLEDLSLMALNWLTCTDPNPPCVGSD